MDGVRWSYIMPRLVAISLLAAGVVYGLPPVIRWSLTTSGQAAVGAKVEVGEVECSPVGPKIVIHDLAVADPDKPLSNLLAADRIVLEVEPLSLTKKRLVIRRGAIEGLKFSTERATSDELDEDSGASAVFANIASSAAQHGHKWLAAYWTNLRSKLEEDLRREFRSVRLAEELVRRWPVVYEQYDARVKDLLTRARLMEATIRAGRENPLRNLAQLRLATQQVDELRQDIAKLMDDVNGLASQLGQDRDAVWGAWREDRQKFKEAFEIEAVDAHALADYLLQAEVAGRVGTIVDWIERVRSLAPSRREIPQPQRHRGVNVLFAGLRRHPDYLIRSLEVHGQGTHNGQAFELTGAVIGLSTQPHLYGRPTVVKIAGRGAIRLDLEASLDRTGDVPVDRFVFQTTLKRGPLQLGLPDSFAIALGDGRDQIEADLTLKKLELTGTLSLKMQTSGLQVSMKDTGAATSTIRSLNAGLADIRSIETKLHVGGSLKSPATRLESTLGSQVLAAVQSAARQEVALRRHELEQALQQQLEAKLNDLNRLAQEHRRQIEEQLTEQQTTLIRLAADTFGLGDRPTTRIGSADSAIDRSASFQGSAFQR